MPASRRAVKGFSLLLFLSVTAFASAQSIPELKQRANMGDAGAQVDLGVKYDRGEGVRQNHTEAVRWYRNAAEQGNAQGQYNLGLMYRQGIGTPQDNAEALRWFRKAAEQGHSWAQSWLGDMYRDGIGVPQNFTEAARWYRKAAEQGDASAKPAKSLSGVFSNDRLKRGELEDYPIIGDDQWREVDGMWVMESKDPEKALLFPEQVKITCSNSDKTCRELSVALGVMGGLVEIMGPDEKIWQIDSWDAHGLRASYGPYPSALAASEKCHDHVLTMTFGSGAVSTSDIPTREKGCEAFRETDSYRLVRGEYYVDTTPGNDGEKPVKPSR
jgi:hypothetical protein